jgi:CHAT domain-containing protein
VPAVFPEVERKLGTQLHSLVHFVCHGGDDLSGIQTIDLEDDKMSCNAVLGMTDVVAAFAKKHPLVFLNACEVGRTTPALVGLGGFADSFIQIGASAVIAPLWSVEDSVAHDVAKEFYARVKAKPNIPFAEILRGIRAKAYEAAGAKDTYAAYCFYGDPAAVRVV